MKPTTLRILGITSFLAMTVLHSLAQPTAFTYQGRLENGGNPANGSYDFRFVLHGDAVLNGFEVGLPQTNSAVSVSNGLFTVMVDFGPAWDGQPRWLEVGVRPGGSLGSFVSLNPRQSVTSAPKADYANRAGALTSILPEALLPSSAVRDYANETISGQFTFSPLAGNPPFLVNSSVLVGNLNADLLDGLDSAAFWKLGGNSGTTPGTHFLGTTDDKALTLKVNNTIALQIVPGATLPNVVGGLGAFRPSVLASGVSGAVIAGGNAPSGAVSGFGAGDFHAVYDNNGTVGGGFGNKAGSGNGDLTDAAFATVSGGVFNSATAYAANVAGGDSNVASGSRAGIGGGYGNGAAAHLSVIGGGLSNFVQPGAERASIGGGWGNGIQVNATDSTIAGGRSNLIHSGVVDSSIGGGHGNTIKLGTFGTTGATIAGGFGNTIEVNDPRYATIAGGYGNVAGEVGSTVGGGYGNTSSGAESTVAGGYQNSAGQSQATVGGGYQNNSSGASATIAGGANNSAGASYATVGGGNLNGSSGFGATVSGGAGNTSSGQYSAIGGGNNNIGSGLSATVPGGSLNTAAGNYSFAAGQRAKANHQGSFVWADSQSADFSSAGTDQFIVRAAGGVGVNKNNPATALDVNGTVSATAFNNTSDREAKENFTAIDSQQVLEKVTALPILRWNFKGERTVEHVGPMAQDFHAAFRTGTGDKHIATVDADGVALAAIQGLNSKFERQLKERDMQIEALRQTVAELKAAIENPSEK